MPDDELEDNNDRGLIWVEYRDVLTPGGWRKVRCAIDCAVTRALRGDPDNGVNNYDFLRRRYRWIEDKSVEIDK